MMKIQPESLAMILFLFGEHLDDSMENS